MLASMRRWSNSIVRSIWSVPNRLVPRISWNIVVVCLLWYLISSFTSQSTRFILLKLQYPLFLSQFQYFSNLVLSGTFLVLSRSLRTNFNLPRGILDGSMPLLSKLIYRRVLPMAILQFMGKYWNLVATSLIPLATISSVRALSPLLIVIGYRVFYSVKFPLVTYFSLTPLLLGVMLILWADSSNVQNSGSAEDGKDNDMSHLLGLLYCCMGTITFAIQNIYGKLILTWQFKHPEKTVLGRSNPSTPQFVASDYAKSASGLLLNEKDPVELSYRLEKALEEESSKPDDFLILFYFSQIGFAMSLTGFLFTEYPYFEVAKLVDSENLLLVIISNSLSHFLQALLSFYLLRKLPTLSYSIASLLKRIVLIALSMIFVVGSSVHTITSQQMLGLLLVATGLYCYDKWGSRLKEER